MTNAMQMTFVATEREKRQAGRRLCPLPGACLAAETVAWYGGIHADDICLFLWVWAADG